MARIWTATSGDAATVARLISLFRDWIGNDQPGDEAILAGVTRLIAEPDTEYLLAASGRRSPAIGVCQLRFRHGIWHAAGDCWLEDLFVGDEGRGTGLGRALVEAAVVRARERGCARIQLDVNETNEPALRLYERLGFDSRSEHFGGGRNLMMQRLTG